MNQDNLFADGQPARVATPGQKKRRRRKLSAWTVVDHACKHCLGRVLLRYVDGRPHVRCAQCGASANGGHLALCCCGADCGKVGIELECYKNALITDEVPHEIMVRERRIRPGV